MWLPWGDQIWNSLMERPVQNTRRNRWTATKICPTIGKLSMAVTPLWSIIPSFSYSKTRSIEQASLQKVMGRRGWTGDRAKKNMSSSRRLALLCTQLKLRDGTMTGRRLSDSRIWRNSYQNWARGKWKSSRISRLRVILGLVESSVELLMTYLTSIGPWVPIWRDRSSRRVRWSLLKRERATPSSTTSR